MNILFVENRYATWLYQAIAVHLERDGHRIHWVVQNPRFTPSMGAVHLVPFPGSSKPAAIDPTWLEAFQRIGQGDRNIQHFGGDADHYPHYQSHIEAIIEEVGPGVVFGESTQFHELLTIEACRRRNVPYLFPNTLPYPTGRFVFFEYDRRNPFGGSDDVVSPEEAERLVQSINERSVTPSYMSAAPASPWRRRVDAVKDRLEISRGWFEGERFATPSPIRKLTLERDHRRLRRDWDELATRRPRTERPYVLYALQLQPESTIDVWGLPWNDQAALVERAATALARHHIDLAVKPNPKSKYEISTSLLSVVARHENVVAIPHQRKMSEVFPAARAVLGVTGTVLLEGALAGKHAVTLAADTVARLPGLTPVSAPEDVADVVVKEDLPADVAAGNAAALVAFLFACSYPGEVFDPLMHRQRLGSADVDRLVTAFRDIVRRLAIHR